MRLAHLVYTVMLSTTWAKKNIFTNDKEMEEWKNQGSLIPTVVDPVLNLTKQEYLKPVRQSRRETKNKGKALDKGPKLELEKVKKPEGFNKKKEKITLAPIPDTEQFSYQRYRYIQVTDNKNCSEHRRPCEIEGNDLSSYRIKWNLDTSPESPYPNPKFTDIKKNKPDHWSDGGFHVAKERWTPWPSLTFEAAEDFGEPSYWNVGQKITLWLDMKSKFPKDLWKQRDRLDRIPDVNHRTVLCGSPKDDTICAYWRVAYTGYGVAEYRHDKDEEAELGKIVAGTERIMLSPNLKLAGSGIVCTANENCIERGYDEWGNHKVRGGPQLYPFQDDFR